MIKKLSFLLADDDRDDREFFEEAMLQIVPQAVIKIVNDGRQAIDYLDNCPDDALPCAIILDYNMPHMNGPQVLDWVCKQPRFNGIDKFIWSTSDQQEYIDICLEKGVVEYFVKPNQEAGIRDIAQKIAGYCM